MTAQTQIIVKRYFDNNGKVKTPIGKKSCTYTALAMLVTQRHKQYDDYYINLDKYETEKGNWRFR